MEKPTTSMAALRLIGWILTTLMAITLCPLTAAVLGSGRSHAPESIPAWMELLRISAAIFGTGIVLLISMLPALIFRIWTAHVSRQWDLAEETVEALGALPARMGRPAAAPPVAPRQPPAPPSQYHPAAPPAIATADIEQDDIARFRGG